MSCVNSEVPPEKPKLDVDRPISVAIEEPEDISPPSGKSSIAEDSSSDDDFEAEPEPDYFSIDVLEPPMSFQPNVYRCNPENSHEMMLVNACIYHVIAEYNRLMDPSKSQLRFVDIENATRFRDFNYVFYITFEAFDTVSQQNATYQTEIFCTTENDEKWIHFIRKKGEKRVVFFPIDISDQEEFDFKMIVNGARKMIDLYNDEQCNLQLKKILKAVGNANVCRRVLISFEAEDVMSKQVDVYFAEVYYGLSDDTAGVGYMFRRDEMTDGDEDFEALLEDE